VNAKAAKELAAEGNKFGIATVAWPRDADVDCLGDAFTPVSKDDDAIRQVQRFVNVMRHEQNGGAEPLSDVDKEILHLHSRKGIEGGEWFVEEQHTRMPDECARESGSLRHAAGNLLRQVSAEPLKPDKI
jgi:hypothetical protein